MAEPPYKRARRPDSKQMWDEADRRAPLPSRERDEPRDYRRDDRRDDRNRRYRSRSPRDSRGGRGSDRDRDRRRDDRDRDGRDYRGSGRGYDDRNGRREDDRTRDRDSGRDKPRQRSRDRERDRDGGRRVTRSRSPRRERDVEEARNGEKEVNHVVEKETSKVLPPEAEPAKSRTATPPVSFKVAAPGAQDHDRMEIDSGRAGNKKGKAKGKGKAVEESVEDDDEIVVEDDGMAAMQAMMGFGGFGTTQNKKVAGNDISAVRKEKKTEYRQYMNRVGGFNRPLSPTRE